jgi:N-acyl-D-amino-acid deacylase
MPAKQPSYDVIIRGGNIFDGSGKPPFVADVGITNDTIEDIGQLTASRGKLEIDARDLSVAPGFINMLSWAVESLIEDGRSESDIRQGVTLEIFGEGTSMGPLTDQMKNDLLEEQGDIKYDIAWTSLSEYLNYLVQRGTSCNVASFVGATTLRINILGHEDRSPSAAELNSMQRLTETAMHEGALGVASALIYSPATFADTNELIALAETANRYSGMYISHLRSEGQALLESIGELLTIAKAANIRAEIYHLKSLGKSNWHKMDAAIDSIDQARVNGLSITANMYPYTAAGTGLDAAMPPWVQEGGNELWFERLKDPDIRRRVGNQMLQPASTWENFYFETGPKNMLLVSFKSERLKKYTGQTLATIAAERGSSPEQTAMDLVLEDRNNIKTIYFCMSEQNVQNVLTRPWVSFCSDAQSLAPRGKFLHSSTHPRAYGAFARVLGEYARDRRAIAVEEAIRKLTFLPANNLKLDRRGKLALGYFADVVVFDPAQIKDLSTFDRPHQFAQGMIHVFVNGQHVLNDGHHTGATPGRVILGPGARAARSD